MSPGCLGHNCPCAGPWHLQELLSFPLQLLPAPRACCGSRDMSQQEWDRATCPCSWGPPSPFLISFCLPHKGEQHWQLPYPLFRPFPLATAWIQVPGLYAAPSIPYITCCEQVHLFTLSIMPVVPIACPASGKYNSHCICRQHEQKGQNTPCPLMPQEQKYFILTAAWAVGLGMGAEYLRQAGLKFWGLGAVGNRSEDGGCVAASWEETA